MSWPWGQCTWYVANFFNIPFGGNARDWASNARAAGWAETSAPTVGAVAAYQPGVQGALGDGHVAIVTAVNGSSYTISESNATAGLGKPDSRTLTYKPGNDATFLIPPVSARLPTLSQLFPGGVPAAQTTPGNVLDAQLAGSQGLPGTNAPIVGPLIAFMFDAGEVVLGLGLMMAGLWLTAGSPGSGVLADAAALTPVAAIARPRRALRQAAATRTTQQRAQTRFSAAQGRQTAAHNARMARVNEREEQRNEIKQARRDQADGDRGLREAHRPTRSIPSGFHGRRPSLNALYGSG